MDEYEIDRKTGSIGKHLEKCKDLAAELYDTEGANVIQKGIDQLITEVGNEVENQRAAEAAEKDIEANGGPVEKDEGDGE